MVAAVFTTTAAASPKNFYGVNLITPVGLNQVQKMRRGGIRTVRFGFNWASAQPARYGGFDWGATDDVVRTLASGGIGVQPFLYGTPVWLQGGSRPPVHSAIARRRWRTFVREAVLRYGTKGVFWKENPSLPYRPIHYWQIWNEPNFPLYWHPKPSPRQYLRMLKSSAKVIRQSDSQAKVVLAGLGPGRAKRRQILYAHFLDRLYNLGAKPFFDVAADHPYAAGALGAANQIRHTAAVMRRHRDGSTPLWIDEVGWSSGHLKGFPLAVGPRGQARRLRETLAFVRAKARKLGIGRVDWFAWRDPPRSQFDCGSCFNFGLLTHHGRAKRSWHAFTRFAAG